MNTTPASPLSVTATPSDQAQQVDATRRAPAPGERALVLHGGGSAGNAWEIGVIAGLFAAGLDLTGAELTIGTSAGSTAAAQITSGTLPTALLAHILAAPGPGRVRSEPTGEAFRMCRWPTTWR